MGVKVINHVREGDDGSVEFRTIRKKISFDNFPLYFSSHVPNDWLPLSLSLSPQHFSFMSDLLTQD